MIETFDDIYDAILFIEVEAEMSKMDGEFKAELFKTPDGRWRVGITRNNQLELKL